MLSVFVSSLCCNRVPQRKQLSFKKRGGVGLWFQRDRNSSCTRHGAKRAQAWWQEWKAEHSHLGPQGKKQRTWIEMRQAFSRRKPVCWCIPPAGLHPTRIPPTVLLSHNKCSKAPDCGGHFSFKLPRPAPCYAAIMWSSKWFFFSVLVCKDHEKQFCFQLVKYTFAIVPPGYVNSPAPCPNLVQKAPDCLLHRSLALAHYIDGIMLIDSNKQEVATTLGC